MGFAHMPDFKIVDSAILYLLVRRIAETFPVLGTLFPTGKSYIPVKVKTLVRLLLKHAKCKSKEEKVIQFMLISALP